MFTRLTKSHHGRTGNQTAKEKAARIRNEEPDELGWTMAELAAHRGRPASQGVLRQTERFHEFLAQKLA